MSAVSHFINIIPMASAAVFIPAIGSVAFLKCNDIYNRYKSKKIIKACKMDFSYNKYKLFIKEYKDLWMESTLNRDEAVCFTYEKWVKENRV